MTPPRAVFQRKKKGPLILDCPEARSGPPCVYPLGRRKWSAAIIGDAGASGSAHLGELRAVWPNRAFLDADILINA
jgi:hypothetical protein